MYSSAIQSRISCTVAMYYSAIQGSRSPFLCLISPSILNSCKFLQPTFCYTERPRKNHSAVKVSASVPRRSMTVKKYADKVANANKSVKSFTGQDTFFVEEGVTWKTLGVSEELENALLAAGLSRPSLVQAAAIPSILSGKDVIVAAETGSGKTHGYLVPIIQNLRGMYGLLENGIKKGRSGAREFALVLCPNAMLCEQAVRMASNLHGPYGDPLLKVMAVSGSQGWPVVQPDVLISTPGTLLNWLFAFDPRRWRRTAFVRDVKYVAEFAISAVDFLHRVGRTARAGQPGLVTSLYTEANRALVDAVRQAKTFGQPVEGAFSRKRSFRNKLKKAHKLTAS